MNLFRCICILLFILNICFAYCFANRNYKAHWLWKIGISIIIFISINTLSSLFGFYLCGNNIRRIGFVITNAILLVVGVLILKLQKEAKTIIEKNNIFWAASFFIFIFFALFLSTGQELLPIWGNVDDVVHFEIISSFYNRLNLENPLPYRGLEDLEIRINEFSYVWAYHYNCALISYIFDIDIWHVMHFFRCFCVAAITASSYLLIPAKSLLSKILCGILCVLGWGNWYVLLNSGYSPNAFGLFFAFLLVGILKNISNCVSNTSIKFLLPLAGLVAVIGYLQVGIFVAGFLAFYYLYQKRRRDIFRLFVGAMGFLPQPAIWNQLVSVFQTGETTVHALQDNQWAKDSPSMLWMGLTLVIVGFAVYKKRFWDLWLILILFMICISLIVSPNSYITYKFILQARLLLIAYICDVAGIIVYKVKKRAKVIAACGLLLPGVWIINKAEIMPINMGIFPINARLQITAGEIDCLNYVNEKYSSEVGIEYLGWDGPTSFIGQKITGEVPYSYLYDDNKWRFRGGCSTQDYVASLLKKQVEERNGQEVILVLNKMNVDDFQILHEYSFLINSFERLYQKKESEVWKLLINNDIKIGYLSASDFSKNEQCTRKQISGYGDCVVLAEKEKPVLLNVDLNESSIDFLVLKGRVINQSSFLIMCIEKGECVYEQEISEFSGWYVLDIDNLIECDELQIEAISRVYSDSVIISEIYYGADL